MADHEHTRRRFEDHCWQHYMAERERRDMPGDVPDAFPTREQLFWRMPDGRYGVLMFNAAWLAWCWAMGERASLEAVPDGWKPVPVEPTAEMCACASGDTGSRITDGPTFARALYLEMLSAAPAQPAQQSEPIDMVLHCPKCGMQHIDEPEGDAHAAIDGTETRWENPPHRSHLCHGCGHIWRPADVPTNGVLAVKTKGKADSHVAQVKPKPVARNCPECRNADSWGIADKAFCTRCTPTEGGNGSLFSPLNGGGK